MLETTWTKRFKAPSLLWHSLLAVDRRCVYETSEPSGAVSWKTVYSALVFTRIKKTKMNKQINKSSSLRAAGQREMVYPCQRRQCWCPDSTTDTVRNGSTSATCGDSMPRPAELRQASTNGRGQLREAVEKEVHPAQTHLHTSEWIMLQGDNRLLMGMHIPHISSRQEVPGKSANHTTSLLIRCHWAREARACCICRGNFSASLLKAEKGNIAVCGRGNAGTPSSFSPMLWIEDG